MEQRSGEGIGGVLDQTPVLRITVGREEVQRPVTLSSRSLESNQGSSRYTVYEERGYERRARALAARARRRSSSSFFECQRSDRPLPF